MRVFVVMGNDYPAAVFTTEKDADEFCARQREMHKQDWIKENPHRSPKFFLPRIHWRSYEFDLQGELQCN